MSLLDLAYAAKRLIVGPKQYREVSQEEYDNYMTGYRLGHPLVGELPITVEHPDNADFQRGLAAGMRDFKRAGRPQIHYHDPELTD
jgi:hypothetical protein